MQGQTSTSIAQQALDLCGNNMPKVSGVAPTFDNSTAGLILQDLYVPTVQAILREYGWDAARRFLALTLSGNAGPFQGGYTYEYLYPPVALEIWELQPQNQSDLNDPLPYRWTVGNTLVNGVQTKVIWSSLQNAFASYNNNPSEATWDAGLQEAIIRALASKLAIALVSKPETAALMSQTAQAAAEMNKSRAA